MSSPGAGFEFPPQDVAGLKRDVLLFAHSIDSLTAHLAFKQTDHEVIDFYARSNATPVPGVPEFDNRHVVDGQRLINFLHLPPSSASRHFELRYRVLGVYDKGKAGSVMETKTILAEMRGGEYTNAVGSAFLVGQGNEGGQNGILRTTTVYDQTLTPMQVQVHPNCPPPEGKKPDVVHVIQTYKDSAHLYRFVHLIPFPAFSQHKTHRTETTTLYTQRQNQGRRWTLGAQSCMACSRGIRDPATEFQARFAAPVKPDDKLVTEAWRMEKLENGWEEVRFATRVERGKVGLSNGRAFKKCNGIKSRQ
ncbi:MAG: hypothetical protein Q9166_005446 [cf. Caloplaca sp. 2 TL-2023]